MKEILLTKGMVALVDDSDFCWLIQWKWHTAECKKGIFYAQRTPRPSRCRRCGGAVKWDTIYHEGKRVDSYRCIMCGRSSEDGDIGVTAVAEKRRL